MLARDNLTKISDLDGMCDTRKEEEKKKKVQQKSPVGISLVHGESRWHLHSKISLN